MYTLQSRKKIVPWAGILAGISGVGLFVFALLFFLASASDQRNQITLWAGDGAENVYIYDDISVDSSLLKKLKNGTRCTRLGGPIQANIRGADKTLYAVQCDDTYGHVDARFVR